jgi:hypothetical protein
MVEVVVGSCSKQEHRGSDYILVHPFPAASASPPRR